MPAFPSLNPVIFTDLLLISSCRDLDKTGRNKKYWSGYLEYIGSFGLSVLIRFAIFYFQILRLSK